MHYLDNASTTKVAPEVSALVHEVMDNHWANPSSLYAAGLASEEVIEAARKTILTGMGVKATPVGGAKLVFTASGTEADNMAVFGAARMHRHWGNHLVSTGYEHPGVQNALQTLAESEGFELTEVPPDADGRVNPQALLEAITPKTVLLCAMQVNNETGAVLDTAALAKAAKQKNARMAVHVDAVQAFAKYDLGLAAGHIDTCAVAGHKLHAPKGIGALYIRKGFALPALLVGGGQEFGLRPGTQNIAYIAGFAKAVERALQSQKEYIATAKKLRVHLEKGLAALQGTVFNSPSDGWAGICNFSLPGIRSEVLLHHLEKKGVFVSGGSACSKGKPSHTLLAMGLPEKQIRSALRVSFGRDHTLEDVDALLEGLAEGMRCLARE